MKHMLLAIGFLVSEVLQAAEGQCTASTVDGYSCEKTVLGNTVAWQVSGGEVKIGVITSGSGYLGIGFGPGMLNSQVLVFTPGSNVQQYNIGSSSKSFSSFSITTHPWLKSVASQSGRYEFVADTGIVGGGEVQMIMGIGSSTTLNRHASRGRFSLDFSASSPPPSPYPLTSAPATQAPSTAAPAIQVSPTVAPAIQVSPTVAPATQVSPTVAPATRPPVTVVPSTSAPSTSEPDTPPVVNQCAASTVDGYSCEKTVLGNTVAWQVSGEEVKIGVFTTRTGFLGIGFGRIMFNGQVLIFTPRIQDVQQFMVGSDSYDISGFTEAPHPWLKSWTATQTGEVKAYEFVADMNIVGNGVVAMISAFGDSTTLEHHGRNQRAQFTLDFSAVPGDVVVPTLAPRNPGVTGPPSSDCTPSSVERVQGVLYECTRALSDVASLHWTREADATRFAVTAASNGWVGFTFPDTAGSMGPARGYLMEETFSKLQVGSGRTAGALTRTALGAARTSEVLQENDATAAATGERALGVVTIRFTEEAVLEEVDFNVALHETELTASSPHTYRRSFSVNLVTGAVEEGGGDKKSQAVTHGVVMIVVWAFLVPIGILVKRHGPACCSGKLGGKYPIPFVVHASVMFISVVTTIVVAIVALKEFDGSVRHSHRELGITVMTLSVVQVLTNIFKCDNDSPNRKYFRYVHAGLGSVTWCIAVVQMFLGAKNLDELYGSDAATPLLALVITGTALFVVTSAVAAILAQKATASTKQGPVTEMQAGPRPPQAPSKEPVSVV